MQYPYFPDESYGCSIEYVSKDNVFMKEAEKVCKEQSTDLNHPTGAVAVRDGEIVGIAANRSALKNKQLLEIHRKGVCVRRLLNIPSGEKYWLCPGCASYRYHAESGAAKDAQKKGKSEGAEVYLYGHWWCCKPCWDAMIGAGIKKVFLIEGADSLFK